MFRFVRTLKRTSGISRQHVFNHRFYMNFKPAKDEIGVVEGVFVMAFLSIAVLAPAGWILSSSCDSHRKRQ